MENINKRLRRLRLFDVIIQSKRDEIMQLRSGISKSPQFSSEPKGSKIGNSNENLNVRIINRTQEIQLEIEQMYVDRDRLVDLIDSLDDPIESMVLRLFYINCKSWKEIAIQMNGHPKTFQNIRRSGMINLEKLDSQNSQNIHLI